MTPAVPGPDNPLYAMLAYAAVAAVVGFVMRRRSRAKVRAMIAATASVEPDHPLVLPRGPRAAEFDAPANPPTPIDHVRDLLGPVPRTFDPSLKTYLTVEAPEALRLRKGDEHWRAVSGQIRLRQRGTIVWAAIVQANGALFQPGPLESGASIVYGFDPEFDAHPDQLQQIAHALFELKGTDQTDPDAATFARMLTLETVRGTTLKVPRRFTEGRDVWHTAILLPRKHLPRCYLTGNLLPVWADPIDRSVVLPIPAAYWPPSLLRYWQPQTPTPAPAKDETR